MWIMDGLWMDYGLCLWIIVMDFQSKLCSVQKKKKIKNKTENRMNWPT